MDKWRCMEKEPPPKDGTYVLLLCELDEGLVPVVARWHGGLTPEGPYGTYPWLAACGGDTIAEGIAKHWMLPLPPPQEPTHG